MKLARELSIGIGLHGEIHTSYAVKIFSKEASLRWIQSNASVCWPGETNRERYRVLRVKQLSVMEIKRRKNV